MTVYYTGHVKHNPETREVALRTIFPEDAGEQFAARAWAISTTNRGTRPATTAMVEDWPDLYVQPAPVADGS
jgi:hypothetical protein